ncbi:ATP-binding protein [Wenjunlia vitaminophila]|uniref:ATP-binding protein n=1 Tax=Wenjunlia vitaminophila TaxID=76728 RepID=A0A0T6LQR1_WENVI|nr:ATP/GTP-binding protein [Wenjunlia vitaminophila]KRV48446.1 ATP-binding protein [Wenjunlia vitaminophila]
MPNNSDDAPAQAAFKIIVAGGFGVGKTTLVGSVSEIRPLTTEERLTTAGIGVDDLDGIEDKTDTTVAMDFGRITLPEAGVVVYLFGTPGQDRFWFVWDALLEGAAGAIVLVDTRHLGRSFPAVDFFENRRLPFVVGVNAFDGHQPYSAEQIRGALRMSDPQTPIIELDARSRTSSRDALIALMDHLIDRARPVHA